MATSGLFIPCQLFWELRWGGVICYGSTAGRSLPCVWYTKYFLNSSKVIRIHSPGSFHEKNIN